MAEPAADAAPPGLSSPSDPRIGAVLGLVWKYGLYPVAFLVLAGFLIYRLDNVYVSMLRAQSEQLRLLEGKVDDHQAAMERAAIERRSEFETQVKRLKGICYGVTEEGSRARAFCEAD